MWDFDGDWFDLSVKVLLVLLVIISFGIGIYASYSEDTPAKKIQQLEQKVSELTDVIIELKKGTPDNQCK